MNNARRGNFLGHDGFIWWIGVIENRLDPLNLGRCQVRIKGLHSKNLTEIPTESLPWAQPLFPINQSFSTPATLTEGDMVVGFFLDGDSAQFPVILGMFHGIPEDYANPNAGFNDPRTSDQLHAAPRKPKSITFNTTGKGVTINDNTSGNSYPDVLNEPTTDRLVRNESIDNTIVKSKRGSVVKVKDAKGGTWTEPTTPYNSIYPYNHVLATESGHYLEFDDTPGAERVHLYHRSGTFSETHPDGTHVEKITKNKYTIVMGDDDIFVMGDCSITIQGNAKVYVQKDCDLKVDGTMNQTIGKDLNITVQGNITTKVSGDIKTDVSGTITQTSIGVTKIIGSSVDVTNV